MHLAGAGRHRLPGPPGYKPANHTPRAFEVQALSHYEQQPHPTMFCPTGMAVGPVYLSSSTSQPPHQSKYASPREALSDNTCPNHPTEPMRIAEASLTTPTSSPDGKLERVEGDKMMTQTNLLVLPSSNPSYQMAYFLKTTGPSPEPPSKANKTGRVSSMPRNAFRLFRSKDRKQSKQQTLNKHE